jgi:hypothetical protein
VFNKINNNCLVLLSACKLFIDPIYNKIFSSLEISGCQDSFCNINIEA